MCIKYKKYSVIWNFFNNSNLNASCLKYNMFEKKISVKINNM